MSSLSSRTVAARSLGYHRIRSQRIVDRIVTSTGLAPPDVVYEFGAGDGQITAALARRCRRVVCIETDRALWQALRVRFSSASNVQPVLADFLAFELPTRNDYKLISNVPFGMTAPLMRRLSGLANPPTEAYLILQLEAAQKWGGIGHETLASVMLKTRFAVEPLLPLRRDSFAPRPNVDCMLLGLKRRARWLVSSAENRPFEAFVRRGFEDRRILRTRRPSELTVADWLDLFRKRYVR